MICHLKITDFNVLSAVVASSERLICAVLIKSKMRSENKVRIDKRCFISFIAKMK